MAKANNGKKVNKAAKKVNTTAKKGNKAAKKVNKPAEKVNVTACGETKWKRWQEKLVFF